MIFRYIPTKKMIYRFFAKWWVAELIRNPTRKQAKVIASQIVQIKVYGEPISEKDKKFILRHMEEELSCLVFPAEVWFDNQEILAAMDELIKTLEETEPKER